MTTERTGPNASGKVHIVPEDDTTRRDAYPSAHEIAQALGGSSVGTDSGWHDIPCPARGHDDKHASCGVKDRGDGSIAVKCHAGCQRDAILDGIEAKGLRVRRRTGTKPKGLTLRAYADAKRLPLGFLASINVHEEQGLYGPRLLIPYHDENGEVRIVRHRVSLNGDKRFFWPKGTSGKLCLYGLDRLPAARTAGHVVLTEGESDCHTMWHCGFHAVGVPGASNWREKRDAAALDGVGTIYVIDERDKGAESLLSTLKASAVRDRVRVVTLDGAKDPSDLYLNDPAAFRQRFEAALREAKPLVEAETVWTAPSQQEGNGLTDAERDAIGKLAAGEIEAFVSLAEADQTFPFAADAIKAEAKVARERPREWEKLHIALKNAGVRLTALDKLIAAEANLNALGAANGGQGRPIEFAEIEPCEGPVDGTRLLADISDAIGRYMIMTKDQRDAVALWIVHTYTHDFRDYSPLLVVTSPEPGCAKTRLEEVLERIVLKPLTMSGLTAASLVNIIDEHHPTVLIDEYDAILNGDREKAEAIRACVDAAHKRSGAFIIKMVQVGDGWTPRKFFIYTPIALAGIDKPQRTIIERGVVVRLKKKLRSEAVARLRGKDGDDLRTLARKIVRFVSDNDHRIRHHDPDMPKSLTDRECDKWDSLLAVADVAGGEWPQRARDAALALTGADAADADLQGVKQTLLADIRNIFVRLFPTEHPDHKAERTGRPDDGPRLLTRHLLVELHKLEERQWSVWGKARKPMTDIDLGALLRGYEIHSKTVRGEDAYGNPERGRGYYLRDFKETFERYLRTFSAQTGVSSRDSVTNQENVEENRSLEGVTNSICHGSENGGNANNSGLCHSVTPPNRGEAEKVCEDEGRPDRDGLL
jgi:putative DNA primase/helicase